MGLLLKGDRIHLSEPLAGQWRGIVSRDQARNSRAVFFRLESDPPDAPERSCWRYECALVREPERLVTRIEGIERLRK
jgi:hypothetical protein